MDEIPLKLILVTPARNEEDNIQRVIESVINQTHLPFKWIIVSDGSTDRTDEIVKKYCSTNPWIEMIRMPEHGDRQFAAKVQCFNAGYEKVKKVDFDVIGNLDADVSFDNDYFDFLLNKFAEDQTLGVAGTPFVENGKHYNYRFANIEHVSGACQLFRRKCFEEIGGYVPIRGGGIDWVAVTTARMMGWKTRTFIEKTCFHHRKMGTGTTSPMVTWFKQGVKDYFLGNHPLWEIFRVFYQMSQKPFIIGGGLLFCGFVWAYLINTEIPISSELKKFIRREQMQRLRRFFSFQKHEKYC